MTFYKFSSNTNPFPTLILPHKSIHSFLHTDDIVIFTLAQVKFQHSLFVLVPYCYLEILQNGLKSLQMQSNVQTVKAITMLALQLNYFKLKC